MHRGVLRVGSPKTVEHEAIPYLHLIAVGKRHGEYENPIAVDFKGMDRTPVLVGEGRSDEAIGADRAQDQMIVYDHRSLGLLETREEEMQIERRDLEGHGASYREA